MSPKAKFSINLESLIDLSGKLNETYDRDFILNSTLLSLMGKLKYLRAIVLVPDNGQFYTLTAKGRHADFKINDIEISEFSKLNGSNGGSELRDNGYDVALPIKYRDEVKAILAFGKRFSEEDFSEEEEKYIALVSEICANALKNAENHFELIDAKSDLEKRNLLLSTLFEIRKDFSSLLNRDQILRMLSFNLMGQLMVSRFAVFQIDDSGISAIINRFDAEFNENIIEEIFRLDSIQSLQECECSEKETLEKAGIKVVSPMILQGETKGILLIGRKMSNKQFESADLQFLNAIGNTAISSLENERLFREEVEKKRLESELNFALEIQSNLLPKNIPQIEGFDLFGRSIPSYHVGGDYYDIIQLDENRYLLAVADVSGKGMPASLLMANVQASLRILTPLDLGLEEIIQRTNNVIYENTSPDKFVTFFGGILNKKDRTFEYINAGHNPPFLLDKHDKVSLLSEGGLILGVMPGPLEYFSDIIKLKEGDRILMFTDGVNESHNEENEEFGDHRIIELMKDYSSLETKEFTEKLIQSVLDHADINRQNDDITLLYLKIIN